MIRPEYRKAAGALRSSVGDAPQLAFPALHMLSVRILSGAIVYGVSNQRGYYRLGDHVVSIIGIRVGLKWKIHTQKRVSTPGDDYRVLSGWQQYPNCVKV